MEELSSYRSFYVREIVRVKKPDSMRPDGGGSVIRGICVVNGKRTGGSWRKVPYGMADFQGEIAR